jgi:hypothetical protein
MIMFRMGADCLGDLFRHEACFRRVATEDRHAAGELEGLPASLSGGIPMSCRLGGARERRELSIRDPRRGLC